MERTLVNSGYLYQLSEELDWQVCRVPRIPNFKPVKKRSFRLSWGSSTVKISIHLLLRRLFSAFLHFMFR